MQSQQTDTNTTDVTDISSTESTFKQASSPSKKCPWYQPLCTVTPVSKILAMVLFIVLPFLGFWLGYVYKPIMDVAMISDTQSTQIKMDSSADAMSKRQVTNNGVSEKTSSTSEYFKTDGPLIFKVNAQDTVLHLIDYVRYSDNKASAVAQLPYVQLIASSTGSLFLSAPCFRAVECTFSGLYKFDTKTNTISEMKVSNMYDQTEHGSSVSPNETNIITTSYNSNGLSLLNIDLLSDTVKVLETFSTSSKKSYCNVGIGCKIRANWIGEDIFELTIFDFSVNPASTSTVKVTI